MSQYFRLVDSKIELDPFAKILKAQDYETFLDAEQLLLDAKKTASQIIEDAKAVYASEKNRGYQEGMQGATQERALILQTCTAKLSIYIKELEMLMSEVMASVLQKVLGKFSSSEIVLQMVKTVLSGYTKKANIKLKLHPDVLSEIDIKLHQLVSDHPFIEHIELIPDYDRPIDECLLETQSEVILLSLQEQIAILTKLMQTLSAKGVS
jgi:type III secretion protein L